VSLVVDSIICVTLSNSTTRQLVNTTIRQLIKHMQTIFIQNRPIGQGHPVYIIAEAGVNHNGSLDLALELVREAKKTGADCVKFQTFKAAQIVTPEAPKANYQLQVTDPGESQFDMLKKLELQTEDWQKIMGYCHELDIQFLSTPYNKEDADLLADLGVDAFKIASGQLVETPFLQYVAHKGKPMIISSGMATLAEVYEGVQAIRSTENQDIILLQCTTNYPSSLQDANIRAMCAMQQSLNIQIGYSDHVPSNYACYSAVALGACLIEKHFTLDTKMEGPDHSSSLDPQAFTQLVEGIRSIEASLGSSVKNPSTTEIANTQGMRRSIIAHRPLAAGTIIEEKDLGYKRPATGISPSMLHQILGKTVRKDIPADTPIPFDAINW